MRHSGIEVKNPEGLHHARWLWSCELEHVRKVMRSRYGTGYKFCIVQSAVSDRVFSLRTNMMLTSRLTRKLKDRPHDPQFARYYERSFA